MFLINTLLFVFSASSVVDGKVIPTSRRPSGYVKFPEPVKEVVLSPKPHTYIAESDLPKVWDWRNVNGTNFCNHVYSQETPNHCGR